jgi:stage II sporulation protein D
MCNERKCVTLWRVAPKFRRGRDIGTRSQRAITISIPPRRSRSAIRRIAATATATVTAFALLTSPVTAVVPARTTVPPSFLISGHGDGHGHGMSQYGARGAAAAGLSAARIIAFYYQHTALTTWPTTTVRVQVSDDGASTIVAAAPGLTVTGVPTALPSIGIAQWKLVPSATSAGLDLAELGPTGWKTYKRNLPARADFAQPGSSVRLFAYGQARDYRGTVGGLRSGSGVLTINRVGLDDYTRGVVPSEMPSSWGPAAVQAQAIAARTYALYAVVHNAGSAYDICDSNNCQVYGGLDAEQAASNAAVTATQGQVATYQGSPIFAQFSSSDGGWTADGGQPYLTSQADPYEQNSGDPYLNWNATVPASRLAGYYGLASVSRIQLTQDGHGAGGGRVLSAVVVGKRSNGSAAQISVTGFGLMNTLGVYTNFFSVRNPIPVGVLDSIRSTDSRHFTLSGWAYGDGTAAGRVQIVVTTSTPTPHLSLVTTVAVGLRRPDVQARYQLPTADWGFRAVVTVPRGTSQVCLYASTSARTTANQIACRTVVVPSVRR